MGFSGFQLGTVLQIVGPIAAFLWALRLGASRERLILAAAMGGMPAGLVAAMPFINLGAGTVGLFYVAYGVLAGGMIGIAGVLVRAVIELIKKRS